MRRAKGRGHPIVWGDGSKVSGVEVVQLANKKIDVVRGERIVLWQIVESDKGESSREISPKNMNGGTGVLRGTDDVHHRGVKGEGWRNMYLNDDQRVVMNFGSPLKVVERTNKKGGSSETCI